MRHPARWAVGWLGILVATAASAQPPPPPPTAEPAPPVEPSQAPPAQRPPAESPPAESPPAEPPPTEPPPTEPPPSQTAHCDVATCQHFGQCPNALGQCGADLNSCRASLRCRTLGFCTPQDGECVIGANQDCEHADVCRTHGLCAARGQRCVAERAVHCLKARVCADAGACEAQQGMCVRGVDGDAQGNLKPRSSGLRTTGIALSIAGPLLGGIGTGLMLADDDGALVTGLFMAPLGGALLLMGIPMWMIGGQEIPASSETQSMGALTTGIVLSSLGIGTVAMGGVAFGSVANNALGTIPMVVGGSMLVGGLALGIYGIATKPISQNATLSVGPGSFDMTIKF